jgi:hypothetical protein
VFRLAGQPRALCSGRGTRRGSVRLQRRAAPQLGCLVSLAWGLSSLPMTLFAASRHDVAKLCGPAGVFESNTNVWPIIKGFSQAMAALDGSAASGCASYGPTALPASGPCSDPGYEGPSCKIDINECARQTAGCDPNAACTNTPGSFSCRCFDGYTGNGTSCAPNSTELGAVQSQYVTDGTGRLSCSEGQAVAYPQTAPGFQYDMTQGTNQQVGTPPPSDLSWYSFKLLPRCAVRGSCPVGAAEHEWLEHGGGANRLHAGMQLRSGL